MFVPTFMHHRGQRILRIDLSGMDPAEIVAAADEVQRVVAAEAVGSVRILTLLYSRVTADASAALRRCALTIAPHLRASAMVGSNFWKLIAEDAQAHGRPDLRIFNDEASALDWLASQ
jgi:hypothetical protein